MWHSLLSILVLLCTAQIAYGDGAYCRPDATSKLTNVTRQKFVDYHNSFRSSVALNKPILNPSYVSFNFPYTSKNMYKVGYSCELEGFARNVIQICSVAANSVAVNAGVTVIGSYIENRYNEDINAVIYNAFRQWLWDFYQEFNTTSYLQVKKGLAGAQVLKSDIVEVGCEFKDNCWIPQSDGTQKKMVAIACAYNYRAVTADTVYSKGPACNSDDDCVTFPVSKCITSEGLCGFNPRPPPYGPLSIKGNKLVNENGTPVQLVGMSFFSPTWPLSFTEYYRKRAVEHLKCSWNSNVVRVPFVTTDYVENAVEHVQRLTPVIDAAIELGIYVIIDWHSFNATMYQLLADNFFQIMSYKYGHFPHVLYEILNEPSTLEGQTSWENTWENVLKPYHVQVINSIRKKDRNNVIIVGTPFFSGRTNIAADSPIVNQTNIAYTQHYYAASSKVADIEAANMAYTQKNLPLFVTEYGTMKSSGKGDINVTMANLWWQFLDSNKISYINWAINDQDGISSASFTPGTTVEQIPDDAHASYGGKLIKDKLKSMNNGISC